MLLREKDKQSIIRLARKVFRQPVKIWAYGSRVNGQAHEGSDLDLVVLSGNDEPLCVEQFCAFQEVLQDSRIPILVQVMVWDRIPQSFKTTILKNYEVLVEID